MRPHINYAVEADDFDTNDQPTAGEALDPGSAKQIPTPIPVGNVVPTDLHEQNEKPGIESDGSVTESQAQHETDADDGVMPQPPPFGAGVRKLVSRITHQLRSTWKMATWEVRERFRAKERPAEEFAHWLRVAEVVHTIATRDALDYMQRRELTQLLDACAGTPLQAAQVALQRVELPTATALEAIALYTSPRRIATNPEMDARFTATSLDGCDVVAGFDPATGQTKVSFDEGLLKDLPGTGRFEIMTRLALMGDAIDEQLELLLQATE